MHPVLFKLGSLQIHTYGVLVALGFMFGLMLAARQAKKEGIAPQTISDLGLWLVVAGMLGGKLFHILFYWHDFIEAWHAIGIASLREGFVFFGGFIAAAATAVLYARRKHLPLAKLADSFAAPLALGHGFGRLGCFFEGCCYGKVCHLPWAIHFPGGHPTHGLPVQPTELYESFANFALFAGLTLFYRHKKFDGQVWWLYVLFYSVLRFTIEFARGDYDVHYLGIFTSAQLIAVVLFLAAVAGLIWTPKPVSR
jgi:phosphatidylglycerol---prolipoprotein diacylglyceryl transferase